MKIRSFLLLLAMLASLVSAATAVPEAGADSVADPAVAAITGHVVRIGAYDNPPKIFRANDGEVAGFWADLTEIMAQRAGWRLEWVWGSWQECVDNLEAGRIDLMVDVGYSAERASRFVFSTEPVLLSWSRLYVRQGDERIKAIPDLAGKRIGTLHGAINTDGPNGLRDLVQGFDLDCEIVEYPDFTSEFEDLEAGRIDAGVTNRDFGQLKAAAYRVQQTGIIFQPLRIMFACSSKSLLMPYLATAVDHLMHDLKKDPNSEYYRLLARDFEAGVTERRVTPGWVLPALGIAALLALAILGAFLAARLQIRRARQDLAHSEARYKEIFDSTGDAIFIHDIDTGHLVDVNQAMLRMYRCTRRQALESDPGQFSSGVPPFTFEGARERLQAAAEGRDQVFDWQARDLEGRVFWVEVALHAAEFGGGRWIIATVRDIDERKRMEKELLKAEQLKSLGVLAGGIAHDFNNMLTAVMGNASLARDDLGEGHPVQPMLKDIENAAMRARTLTRQLLTFAKGGDPVREIVRLETLVRDAAGFVLRGSGDACSFDFAPGLWPVGVDPGQIAQVVQNLVINARQATGDHGHIAITVANVAEDGTSWVRLTVTDDGPGFSEEDLSHACDPYYTTKADGTGLGLSICHSIVHRHGGRILLDNMASGGARIMIDLPATPHAEPVDKTAATGIAHLEADILVMDDDTQVRDVLVRMLQGMGCRVAETEDGQQAVEAYGAALEAGKPFAAVIMDLTIPGGMGGKEAAVEILARDPEARLLVSSGYSSDPVLADFGRFGFCAAVVKPYRLADLQQALEKALSGTR